MSTNSRPLSLDVNLGGALATLTATECAQLRAEIRETVARFLARRAEPEPANTDRAQLAMLAMSLRREGE